MLEADDEHSLYRQLKAQGLFLRGASLVGSRARRRAGGITMEVLAEFSHQMTFILRSGISVVEGIEDLKRQMGGLAFSHVLEGLIRDVSSGSTLSQAMGRQPQAFPSYYVAVIRAGEAAGSLEEAFQDMASYLEWLLQTRRQVKQAMTYPIIVMTLIAIALVIFIMVVVPRLVSFIRELNRPMPLPTQMLVWLNDWVAQHWYLVGGVMGAATLLGLIAWQFSSFRLLWDKRKLAIPVLGSLMRELVLLRFVRYLRVLYKAGIQIHQAFGILQTVVPNRYYQLIMARIADQLQEGRSLGEALEEVGGFPPLMERTIRVGEQTGTLEDSLDQLGINLERTIDARIKRLVSLIEPMLLMAVGVVLILVIASVLWPIYTILGELG